MALFIGPFWVLLCIFWLNSVVFWANLMLRFPNVFYTISTLSNCTAKLFFLIAPIFALLIFTLQLHLVLIALFCSRAISGIGWDGMGWDLSVGWLYENRLAVLITIFESHKNIWGFGNFFLVQIPLCWSRGLRKFGFKTCGGCFFGAKKNFSKKLLSVKDHDCPSAILLNKTWVCQGGQKPWRGGHLAGGVGGIR